MPGIFTATARTHETLGTNSLLAPAASKEYFALVAHDRARVLEHAGASVAAVRLFELLPRHPIVSVTYAIKELGVSKPTAGRAVEALEKAGVLVELTGKKRDRSWAYQRYLDLLRVGTDLETTPSR